MPSPNAHHERIIDQFSRQSVPFTRVPGHLDAIDTLIAMSGVKATDTVLDVACGPGLVVCDFAKVAAQVVGMDVTPAMLEAAQKRQKALCLENISWQLGDALDLPFADECFDVVITRYSFHHLLSPELALAQMIRVCKKGGSVLVADVAMPAEKSTDYDRLELLRDPSHTHALTEREFDSLYRQSGLTNYRYTDYTVELELEFQLAASFPNSGDDEIVRAIVTNDVGIDRFGINARRVDNEIRYSVPIRVYVGRKPYQYS